MAADRGLRIAGDGGRRAIRGSRRLLYVVISLGLSG
jgi:hypothetical protein